MLEEMGDRIGLLTLQNSVLAMVARGDAIERVLGELSLGVEKLVPGAVAGVTIVDRAARVFEGAVFPSLDPAYAAALPGLRVADKPGSCALAVYNGEIITSPDIAGDMRFQEEWRKLNLQHGIRSIQSRPILASDGTSLGTFVVGFRELRAPEAFDNIVVEAGAELAATALRRYRADQRHDLLISELQHRNRNIFAAVSALAYFTYKGASSPAEFRRALDGRLSALRHAQSLALRRSGADLTALFREILAPYGADGRITMTGPSVSLTPDAAEAFSLTINELATNAAKYGALSLEQGTLSIKWRVAPDPSGEPSFTLTWSERGGPPVSPPAKAGFGRRTIERSLAQNVEGKVTLEFAPTGLCCVIVAPLNRLSNADAGIVPATPHESSAMAAG